MYIEPDVHRVSLKSLAVMKTIKRIIAVAVVLSVPAAGMLISAPSASHADIVINCSSDASICMRIGEDITVMGEASVVIPDDTEK